MKMADNFVVRTFSFTFVKDTFGFNKMQSCMYKYIYINDINKSI